ncbi:hypothetical protein [Neolewinella agarilytica]|uniref:hypothetical protein n=1 Tax=Neolewinella agarilytica TaxID=478744 RepID=UPI0015878A0B|nr:hypothetical protein [Neolewinella agarilytica]
MNRRTIFKEEQDFKRFLNLLRKYVLPVGSLFSYALMEDHFHLVVCIKGRTELEEWFLTDERRIGRQFSHLQNAYAKYFNGKYRTVSGLFERSFERQEVMDLRYFKNVVLYTHRNPIKHGYCRGLEEYPWTSFHELTTPMMSTFLARDILWDKFGGIDAFVAAHEIEDLLFNDGDLEI